MMLAHKVQILGVQEDQIDTHAKATRNAKKPTTKHAATTHRAQPCQVVLQSKVLPLASMHLLDRQAKSAQASTGRRRRPTVLAGGGLTDPWEYAPQNSRL